MGIAKFNGSTLGDVTTGEYFAGVKAIGGTVQVLYLAYYSHLANPSTLLTDNTNLVCLMNQYVDGTTSCLPCTSKFAKRCTNTAVTECYASSYSYNDGAPTACALEFFDFGKFPAHNASEDVKFEVVPSTAWSYTLDFWFFIEDITQASTKAFKVIWKDHISMTFYDDLSSGITDQKIKTVCIPIENQFSISDINTKADVESKVTSWPNNVVTRTTIAGNPKWHYFRCGFDFRSKTAKLKQDENGVLPKTIDYSMWSNNGGITTDITPFSKVFFKTADVSYLLLQNFFNTNTGVFIRNINAFNFLVPDTIDYRYFNLFLASQTTFPYLFSIPLKGATSTTEDFNVVVFKSGTTSTVPLTTNSDPSTTVVFSTSPNFIRMEFLEINKTFFDNTLINKANDINGATVNSMLSDENVFIACDDTLSQFYDPTLNSNAGGCDTTCSSTLIRMFSTSTAVFCTNLCGSNTATCDSSTNAATAIDNTKYSCAANFFNFDNQCFSDVAQNKDNTALSFGKAFNPPGIKIDLDGTGWTKFIIDLWFHPNYSIVAKSSLTANFQDKRVFQTDALLINYNADASKLILRSGVDILEQVETPLPSWTHLIVSLDGTDVKFTTRNNFTVFTLAAGPTLKTLYFCNDGYDTPCNKDFIDAFYSKIRIFANSSDIMSTAIDPLATPTLYYKLLSSEINLNVIKCSGCAVDGVVDWKANVYKVDDQLSKVNIGNFFDYSHTNTFIKTASLSSNRVNVDSTFTCNNLCNQCFGELATECYNCKANYYLEGTTCVSLNTDIGQYVYNISESYDSNLIFDISSLTTLSNHATFFMFMRIKSISTATSRCIIVLAHSSNLCIYFDKDSGDLSIRSGTDDLFKILAADLANFKDKWVPFSIATYDATNETNTKDYFKSMISATFNTTPLSFIPAAITGYFIDRIHFVKPSFDGLISHVTLFDAFIVNAYGVIKNRADFNIVNLTGTNYFNYQSVNSISFLLRGATSSCFDNSWAGLMPTNGYCSLDYNPYIDYSSKGGNDSSQFYISTYPTISWATNNCCLNATKCIRSQCGLNNIPAVLNDENFTYETCDTKSWLNRWLRWDTANKRVVCTEYKALNFNRYKEAKVSLTPNTTEYSLDFNFKTLAYDSSFANLVVKTTVFWGTFINVVISRLATKTDYTIQCSGSGSQIVSIAFTSLDNAEINISCGIDATNKKLRFKADTRIINTHANVTAGNTAADLSILEESTESYGYTLITDLKVYKCISCNNLLYDSFPGKDTNGSWTSANGLTVGVVAAVIPDCDVGPAA